MIHPTPAIKSNKKMKFTPNSFAILTGTNKTQGTMPWGFLLDRTLIGDSLRLPAPAEQAQSDKSVFLLFRWAGPNADLHINDANGRVFVGEPRTSTQSEKGQRAN